MIFHFFYTSTTLYLCRSLTSNCALHSISLINVVLTKLVHRSTSIEMDLKTSTRFCLNFFYFIGISSYHTTTKSKFILICKVSKYLHAILTLYCCVSVLVAINANGILPPFTIAGTIIISIHNATVLMRSAFILVQCIFFAPNITEIMDIFEGIEAFFIHCLHHRICYKQFIQHYQQRVFLIIFFLLIHILPQIIRFLQQSAANVTNRFFVTLHIVTTLNYLHSIFFIELISFHLMQLNVVVISDVGCIHNQLSFRKRLEYYKILHFRMWVVGQRVNRYFGYNWIAILFHAFSNIVYSIFWANQ